jgi:hypothetical protein
VYILSILFCLGCSICVCTYNLQHSSAVINDQGLEFLALPLTSIVSCVLKLFLNPQSYLAVGEVEDMHVDEHCPDFSKASLMQAFSSELLLGNVGPSREAALHKEAWQEARERTGGRRSCFAINVTGVLVVSLLKIILINSSIIQTTYSLGKLAGIDDALYAYFTEPLQLHSAVAGGSLLLVAICTVFFTEAWGKTTISRKINDLVPWANLYFFMKYAYYAILGIV